jgi:hypothetical protein
MGVEGVILEWREMIKKSREVVLSYEIDYMMKRNDELKTVMAEAEEEKKWVLEENRRYLVRSTKMQTQPPQYMQLTCGDWCTVFCSEFDGVRRYYMETVHCVTGAKTTKQISEKDAIKLSAWLSEMSIDDYIKGKDFEFGIKIEIVERA